MSKLLINLLPRSFKPIIWIKSLASVVPTSHNLNRFKTGTKLGRAARHVFSHDQINKILGTNLALAVLATSVLQIPNLNSSVSAADISVPEIINTDTLELVTQKGVQLPTKERHVTQGFTVYHPGADLDGTTGDSIWPIMDGFVLDLQHSGFAYGNAIIITHGNGLTSLYAHLSKILVKKGDQVNTNTVIGLMGATGHATGDHLHLEIRDHGTPINPLTLLPQSR